VALYGNYYRFLRGQYNEEQAVRDFYNWLRTSGIITLVKLRMLRAEKIADHSTEWCPLPPASSRF
jgi:hypothetical protein